MTIELRGVGHRFAGGGGVSDISFTVAPGEVVCLLGPNGSGKSTTLRLLLGLLLGEGTVLVDGAPALRQPLGERMGGIIDDGGLDGTWTVRHYLRLVGVARRCSTTEVDSTLQRHALGELAARRIRTLSLGQAQRVTFAGALMGHPSNLVLDEPLNGVDAHALPLMLQSIRQFADAGGSVLITSHHLAHLERLVDRAVVLQAGIIIADSPIAELLAASAMHHLLVECDDPAILAGELRSTAAAEVTIRSTNDLVVRGVTRRTVGEAAFRRHLILTRLEEVVPTLEDVYLAMTDAPGVPAEGAEHVTSERDGR